MASNNGTTTHDTEEGITTEAASSSHQGTDDAGDEQSGSLSPWWKKYTVKEATSNKMRVGSVLFDATWTTYLIWFSGLPDEVGNSLFYPWILNIVLVWLTIFNWSEIVTETKARTEKGAMRHNMISFVALLIADITEVTLAVLFLGRCTFNIFFVIQAIKFVVVFPQEFSHISKRYHADQRELHGPNAQAKIGKCYSILFVVAILFGVVVPVVNFREFLVAEGTDETCDVFG